MQSAKHPKQINSHQMKSKQEKNNDKIKSIPLLILFLYPLIQTFLYGFYTIR